MAYAIIGIHGLANKPPPAVLEQGWRDAILEGLRRNARVRPRDLAFSSVYWADVMYARPMRSNPEPYLPAPGRGPLPRYADSWTDALLADLMDGPGSALDKAKDYLGIGKLAEKVLQAKLNDLHAYYTDAGKRRTLRQRLRDAIVAARGRRMLIAHSMGSIIAYDVLHGLERTHPRLRIEHFVTIGSPLGLPHVKHALLKAKQKIGTPACVKRWSNFADRMDPVSLDVHLADDFGANARGVTPRDDLVLNGYRSPQNRNKSNHHKSYGYLRAPEVTDAIAALLAREQPRGARPRGARRRA